MARLSARAPANLSAKLFEFDWTLAVLLALIASVGVGMLYSVADGSWSPWALRHVVRFALGFFVMMAVALVDIRLWKQLAYPAYFFSLALLVGVELFGDTVMGAQRWIEIGPARLQPSEVMKIALVLALARFFDDLSPGRASSLFGLVIPAIMIAAPLALVLRQPDLGTSLLIAATGVAVVFLAGIDRRVVALGVGGLLVAAPLAFRFGLKDYQRQRVLTFLDPESDPMGAGYHSLQSKIALGSGGISGKGFMQGTQSHLNFLPEKQTDFIFTMLGEEFGLTGALVVLALYAFVLARGVHAAVECRHQFGRLVIMGVCVTFALYVFINTAMVMGLTPVVGVPLPLISYGGTAMLVVMAGFGLLLSAHIHRDVSFGRS